VVRAFECVVVCDTGDLDRLGSELGVGTRVVARWCAGFFAAGLRPDGFYVEFNEATMHVEELRTACCVLRGRST
jgi:hypothetical protein